MHYQLQFDTLDFIGGAIYDKGRVAQMYRIEQRQLHAAPIHLVQGQVHLDLVLPPLTLDADLIVEEVVGGVAHRLIVLIRQLVTVHGTWVERRYAGERDRRDRIGSVEAAWPESLRVGVVRHDVRHRYAR